MKKRLKILLTLFLLVGCDAVQYDWVELPTEEKNFLSDYKVRVTEASFVNQIFLRPETPEQEPVMFYSPNGKHYLSITLELTRFITEKQSDDHALDEDDFKIKDSLGISLRHNFFSTEKSLTDYTWKGMEIEPINEPALVNLYFEMKESIKFNKYLIVLEVDFSYMPFNSVDIPITHKI